MIYYICRDIIPIKVSISKLIFDEQQKDKNNNNITNKPFIFNTKSEKTKKIPKEKKNIKNKKKKKDSAPPKKVKFRRTNPTKHNNSFERKKQTSNVKLLDFVKSEKKNIKNKPEKNDEHALSERGRKKKSLIDLMDEKTLKTREQLLSINSKEKATNIHYHDNMDSKKNLNSEENKADKKKKKFKDSYDNFELNNMNYQDACNIDKRSCLKTYWSVIMREHCVIFTFFSRNDYNLFYVKIERLLILICTQMTLNGMFFVHETMYKKQTGNTSFAQKIPQIVFSILVTHVTEIILCGLSMTDVHYYQVKALPKLENNNDKIMDIISCMQRKLIGFFVFTFLVILFDWYFISAFCAVYQNTQIIFLRDSSIAILIFLIDPFFIYGLKCILRAISLSKFGKKKLSCIYKLSDLIPIF